MFFQVDNSCQGFYIVNCLTTSSKEITFWYPSSFHALASETENSLAINRIAKGGRGG